MEKWVLYTAIGLWASIIAGAFLSYYYSLVRSHQKAKGEIVSFERSNFILFRQILVPVVSFRTEDNKLIEGQPDCTYFTELNGFRTHRQVTVYYQKDKPENFVIESKTEVVANWLVIGITLVGLLRIIMA